MSFGDKKAALLFLASAVGGLVALVPYVAGLDPDWPFGVSGLELWRWIRVVEVTLLYTALVVWRGDAEARSWVSSSRVAGAALLACVALAYWHPWLTLVRSVLALVWLLHLAARLYAARLRWSAAAVVLGISGVHLGLRVGGFWVFVGSSAAMALAVGGVGVALWGGRRGR